MNHRLGIKISYKINLKLVQSGALKCFQSIVGDVGAGN